MPTTDAPVKRTLDYDEAADLLGVSKITVRKLVQARRIRRSVLGRRVVLNREDVEQLVVGELAPE